MDIQLPVLDGYDATREIKALPGFAAIPIIAVSSAQNANATPTRRHARRSVGICPNPIDCRPAGVVTTTSFSKPSFTTDRSRVQKISKRTIAFCRWWRRAHHHRPH